MTEQQFDEHVVDLQQSMENLILVKGKEYRRNNNPFHNFERAAELNNSDVITELHGFLTKHLVSYLDMIQDIKKGKIPDYSYSEEKLTDIRVYLLLLQVWLKHHTQLVYKEHDKR